MTSRLDAAAGAAAIPSLSSPAAARFGEEGMA